MSNKVTLNLDSYEELKNKAEAYEALKKHKQNVYVINDNREISIIIDEEFGGIVKSLIITNNKLNDESKKSLNKNEKLENSYFKLREKYDDNIKYSKKLENSIETINTLLLKIPPIAHEYDNSIFRSKHVNKLFDVMNTINQKVITTINSINIFNNTNKRYLLEI